MTSQIRTRFAPSPTGFLHVGGIRTALFAYLVAKQANGSFILRIEDTDKNREVEGSADHIKECLKTLGIEWDEGLDAGGDFGPYIQSQRLEIYKGWAQKLIDAGRAYADPYAPEEVQAFREEAQTNKQAFLYRNHRPENPPVWDGTMPLRFKSDPKPYEWHDEVMGNLHSGPEVIDDFILIKSDGYPTYNFAHIVDDSEMQVSHVIRGQEFISSQPNYLNLYEALGLEHPVFATMPHILNEEGNKKLGKRDGAKDVLDYVRDGYLPETLLSFIATLGWNDGSEQEIFTKKELIAKFSLDRVQKSGARFDEKRLLWMNGQFIRRLSVEELEKHIEPFWPEAALSADEDYRRRVLVLVQERLKTFADLPVLSSYFFVEPEPDYSLIEGNKQLKKLSSAEIKNLLSNTLQTLETTEWNAQAIQVSLNKLLESTGQKPGILFSLIRIVTTWAPFSPQLNETLELLGQRKTLERLKQAIS
ncbi:MAG TPA: glutamate--tRNA ligase [Candidatus Saccharibacteria bacterium]|nr:glutamate--tRNA ligase [Candidatus Saccharibacteria bacterium]HRK94177.1 glutamate--tRNA ligase [Candidatus Saccharibacteria bacterium]